MAAPAAQTQPPQSAALRASARSSTRIQFQAARLPWAGPIRRKETLPVGIAPERIRPELAVLDDVRAQLHYRPWSPQEISARFHHRLVYIHPFPNGNGRFSRTMADLLLFRDGYERFVWGANLERHGEVRARYIAALQAADRKDYRCLFELLGV